MAIGTRCGPFEFTVMPFGLTNTLAAFMDLMNRVCRPISDRSIIVFIDNILIYFKTKENHVDHLTKVLETLHKEQVYAMFSKCDFWLQEVQLVGHLVNRERIKFDPAKVEAIIKWEVLNTPTKISSFLRVTRKNVKFIWEEEQEATFETLREKLCEAPVLTQPEGVEDMIEYCDASYHGLGCVDAAWEGPSGIREPTFAARSPTEGTFWNKLSDLHSLSIEMLFFGRKLTGLERKMAAFWKPFNSYFPSFHKVYIFDVFYPRFHLFALNAF
ncbi:hypothetical protein OSB04_024955 [Centaurea solstitialis]|uniref:Reverse transcriptase domain-containing protein n=1 Tax=Centaurea solstitialis TaxID=347529 RepID=A0AA38SMS3_9ASTR|nr:hypothetical protein OSB04_024955 [Centaurea solstitialis]